MDVKWRKDISTLLRFLEKVNPQPAKIHEFRRSFESCQIKKAERVLDQFKTIYEVCNQKLEDDNFIDWFNQQTFAIKLGLKSINLQCPTKCSNFAQYLKWAFSHFNPEYNEGNPSLIPKPAGLPISNKMVKGAIKRANGLDDRQLANILNGISPEQLEQLSSDPNASMLVEGIKRTKGANSLAEKIKQVQSPSVS